LPAVARRCEQTNNKQISGRHAQLVEQ
jgi:hypothetical protein